MRAHVRICIGTRAAAAVVAGVRTGRLTEFGSGATTMITMVEAMLEEGVLVRPEGEAGEEFERWVKAFKKRKAGRMYAQEE
jgi:glycogen synthase